MSPRTTFVAAASVAGLYVSQHMYRKSLRAARGELTDPSVVETPAAKLIFGQPNSLIGLVYYGALLATTPFGASRVVRGSRTVAAALAATSSVYLGYSLLFRTRMPCPYCWTSHALNVALLAALAIPERV